MKDMCGSKGRLDSFFTLKGAIYYYKINHKRKGAVAEGECGCAVEMNYWQRSQRIAELLEEVFIERGECVCE